MPHLLISAAHKSSGKTTLCIGICAELRRRGVRVQPFKKGPDYIDPLWLGQAAGRPCHNLDFYTQDREEIRRSFAARLQGADFGLIEGNKGLYDGLDLDGSNSNSALAALLGAPVVLVIDTQGMTRGIAPLLLGYQAFDPNIHIAGVILNKVGGARHEGKLRRVIEHYTDITLVGSVSRSRELELVERHLGLMPSNEAMAPLRQIEAIRAVVAEQVDLDLLQRLAMRAVPVIPTVAGDPPLLSGRTPVRIGVAMDEAFGFYYPGDLEALERGGAQLVFFSPLRDPGLPSVDGLFIGGGFPEVCMEALEANAAMRQAVRDYVEAGRPMYAECGGLMYLARSLSWQGRVCGMVGVIPADVVMYERPQGRGYVRLRETAACPWGGSRESGREIAAHEFHYSRLENLSPGQTFAFEMVRGAGIDGTHDGIVYKNLLAGYAHLRDVAGHHWTERFLDHVRRGARIDGVPDR